MIFFFSILNLNPRIVIKNTPKHFLNTTEVTNCRGGVERYHVKMINDLISRSGEIFKQDLLFFIIQVCDNQRKVLFYLKVLLYNNFPQFDKSPSKHSSYLLVSREIKFKMI